MGLHPACCKALEFIEETAQREEQLNETRSFAEHRTVSEKRFNQKLDPIVGLLNL